MGFRHTDIQESSEKYQDNLTRTLSPEMQAPFVQRASYPMQLHGGPRKPPKVWHSVVRRQVFCAVKIPDLLSFLWSVM